MGRRGLWAMGAVAGGLLAASAMAQSPGAAASRAHTKSAEAPSLGVLRATANGESPKEVLGAAEAAFDRVIAGTPASKPEAFREAALAARLARQLASVEEGPRRALGAYLSAHPEFAAQLAWLTRDDAEKPAQVYGVLSRLLPGREAALAEHPALAAAVCVVHDRPYQVRLNENSAKAPDPGAIFDYFVTHEREMLLPHRAMPAELLVYVVSVAAPIEDLDWLRAEYAGQPNLGARYKEIRYDYETFLRGTPKKSTAAGYSLRSVKENGGVCIDQAYFAVCCGQALGIPSAIVLGTSATSAHAWVGYLRTTANSANWDFDSGRYEDYQNVRGTIEDPQTGVRLPDAYLAVLESYMMAKPQTRQESAALIDAAERLLKVREAKKPWPPPESPKGGVQTASIDGALMLIESALRATPGYTRGWLLVRAMAQKGELNSAQKKRWADVLFTLCGTKFPDFTLEVLAPMIRSVEDRAERRALWDRAAGIYAKRPDLLVRIRMEEAAMLADAKDYAGAYDSLHEVGSRYVNQCQEAVRALAACAGVLDKAGKPDAIAPMFGDVAHTLHKPQTNNPVFMRQSAWFSVNAMYAEALDRAGKSGEAQRVRTMLGISDEGTGNKKSGRGQP